MRRKFIVVITTDNDGPGWPTPEEIISAIAHGVEEQNPGVHMLVNEVEGE